MIPVEEWFYEIPIVSRSYVTLVFLTTLACQLELVAPFHLYFNWDMILRGQYWRLFTSFFYCGGFSVDFLFHMFFLVRYSRMLEEGSFRGRTLDFLWMLLLGATSMVLIVPLINSRVHIPFLSSPLTFMLVYIWSRRNPYIKMNFLGLFTFTAPYLPWVLLGFTVLLNNFFPAGDLLGMAVAHVYYFFEDVYPRMDGSNGWRLFQTPKIFKYLLEDIWSSRDPSIADLPANMNNLDNEIVMEDINHPDISLAQDEVPNPNVAVDEKEVVIESNVEVKVTSEFKNAENVSSQIGAESSIRQRHIKEEDLKENLD